MHEIWAALMSYPPSLLSLLCAGISPILLGVGLIATMVRKEGGERLAVATTVGPAVLSLLALVVFVLGASSGVVDGAEGYLFADPAQRSARIADGIATSAWMTVLGSTSLTLLVPLIGFGSAVLWSLRGMREGKSQAGVIVAAAGALIPCLLIGGAITGEVQDLIMVFSAVAHAAPADRAALVRQGLAESHSMLASGPGIAVLFGLGLGVSVGGAALAAKSGTKASNGALATAALVALVGVSSVALVHLRASALDEVEAVSATWQDE